MNLVKTTYISFFKSTSCIFNGDILADLPSNDGIIPGAFAETGHFTESVWISLESKHDLTHGIINDEIIIKSTEMFNIFLFTASYKSILLCMIFK